MVPLLRHASVSGIPITDRLSIYRIQALIERTRMGREEILALEKVISACSASAAAVEHLVEAGDREEKRVLSRVVSLEGAYGIDGILTGVPSMIGATGVERVLERTVNALEQEVIQRSTDAVKGLADQLSWESLMQAQTPSAFLAELRGSLLKGGLPLTDARAEARITCCLHETQGLTKPPVSSDGRATS